MRLLSSCFVLSLFAIGCSQKDDHPAGIHVECEAGTNCIKPPPGGGGGGDSSVGDGAIPLDGATSTSISGTVLVLADDDFATANLLTSPAEISVEGATGVPVTATYDGTDYELVGVKVAQAVWATVTPSPADALPTAQPLNTTAATIFGLVTVQGGTLDLIYSLLTATTTRDPGTAHVVLRFVDGTGAPLAGVSVSHLGETIAYDAGGTWSDGVSETGNQGFAIVANVAPGSQPTKQTFTFTTSAGTNGAEIWVAADTVTLTDVAVF